MEYRMKDIMKPPKTLEEQKKEAREAATAEKLFYADRQTKTLEFVGRM